MSDYERISPYDKDASNFSLSRVREERAALRRAEMKRGSEVAREIAKTCFNEVQLTDYFNKLSPMYQATKSVIEAIEDRRHYLKTGEKRFG
jgi:hypothetical protein